MNKIEYMQWLEETLEQHKDVLSHIARRYTEDYPDHMDPEHYRMQDACMRVRSPEFHRERSRLRRLRYSVIRRQGILAPNDGFYLETEIIKRFGKKR